MSEIRRLFPSIKPHFPLLVLALLLLVMSGFLEMIIVTLLEPILNELGAGATGGNKFSFLRDTLGLYGEDRFMRIAFFLVVFSFLKGLFLYFAEYSMSYSGQQVVASLRKRLYAHLLEQSLAFYSRNPTGKLMARVITDTERLQETVSKSLTDFMRQVLLLFFFLGLVFYIDWKLALLSFLLAPLVLMITVRLGRKIRRASLRGQENLADLSSALQETIAGQKIVKAFGMEEYEGKRFNRLTDHLVRINLKAARISALSSPLIEFIGYAAFAPFLVYAHYKVGGGVSVGAFAVFVVALFRLYEPIRKLSRMHLHFQQAFASSQRIFELLETEVELQEAPSARPLAPFQRAIVFEHVFFWYPKTGGPAVLQDINLSIEKGEIVALVGTSGAGKTSLVSLIPRFYDVSQGRLTIDGQDVREVTLASLRRQIAVVTQDTFLFNDTVRNNIAYGREDCPLEEVQRAARAAFLHDFIDSLPDGYDTVIGERGQRLSGGQRQRIAIARAILKDAPILILDEATSALDSESERWVQEALYNLMRQRTTVVIAHRLSTVRIAHRIAVMEQGRIIEIGDHVSLMRRSGVYRKLYDLQFADAPAVSS